MEGLMSRYHSMRPEKREAAKHLKQQECLWVLIVNVKMVVTSPKPLRSAVYSCFGQVMTLGNLEGAGFQWWNQKKETARVHGIDLQWE